MPYFSIPRQGRHNALNLRVACEETLAAGREKEGELVTTSLEFEYLHRISRCEMLIGGDEISTDVIILGECLLTFAF